MADLLSERISKASKQLIDQWEVYGRMPHGSYLVEICDIFECNLTDFMSESDATSIKAAWKRSRLSKPEVLKRDPSDLIRKKKAGGHKKK